MKKSRLLHLLERRKYWALAQTGLEGRRNKWLEPKKKKKKKKKKCLRKKKKSHHGGTKHLKRFDHSFHRLKKVPSRDEAYLGNEA